MRTAPRLVLAVCALVLSGGASALRADETPTRTRPLLNVEIVDSQGTATRLVGFYRLSGEDRFQGWLGAGQIEVAYERIQAIRVRPPARPGARMVADLELKTGKLVHATFDEREGEQLFTGFATFGRVTTYFRDLRELRIVGKTARADLPTYGRPTGGVDLELEDRQGVKTELVAFRRQGTENVLTGLRGDSSVEIPLRIVERVRIESESGAALLAATATLKDGKTVACRIPTYEEDTMYFGTAEFGSFRIRLREIRGLVIHRSTPVLRALDPAAAAQGKEQPDDRPPH